MSRIRRSGIPAAYTVWGSRVASTPPAPLPQVGEKVHLHMPDRSPQGDRIVRRLPKRCRRTRPMYPRGGDPEAAPG
jgi:hypothetical protein